VLVPLAAAALLIILNWPRTSHDLPSRASGSGTTGHATTARATGTNRSSNQTIDRPAGEADSIAGWRDARRPLDGAEPAIFAWPLEESSPVRASILLPADLLD
jgi:hypothetical protein